MSKRKGYDRMISDEFGEFWINTFDNKSDEEMRELLQKEEVIEKLQNHLKSERDRHELDWRGTQDPRPW